MKSFSDVLLTLRQGLFSSGLQIPIMIVISIGLLLSYAVLCPNLSISNGVIKKIMMKSAV